MVNIKEETLRRLLDQRGVTKGEFGLMRERVNKIEDSIQKLHNHETRIKVIESAKESSHKESSLFWLKVGIIGSILIGIGGIMLTLVLKLLLE